jgi:galactokinase/mevalonate kinase-like predicted kinase
VAGALFGLRDVAAAMSEALVVGDLVRMGELLRQNWRHQQSLDARMSTPEMAALERAMDQAGSLGGKAAGSGAGGCMFFLAPDDPSAMLEAARRAQARVLPVAWAMRGVYLC